MAKKQIHHDVLLIRNRLDHHPGARVERFTVDKDTGVFKNDPEALKRPLQPVAPGYRPITNLGSTGTGTSADPARGPVLSALPLHPSPAASAGTTCYLVNAQNLNYTTPWTAEEWNDHADDVEDVEQAFRPDTFSLLIASPAGHVYYLEKKAPQQPAPPLSGAQVAAKAADEFPEFDNSHFAFRRVELGRESEVWMQLRNGCVVGSVLYNGKPAAATRRDKVVPLVNIDSLIPRSQENAP